MRIMRATIVLLASLLPVSGSVAQDRQAPEPGDIVVEGRPAPGIADFVDEVTYGVPGRQVARWNTPVCIRVDGASEAWSSYLAHAIATIASDVRITTEFGPCSATAQIYVRIARNADNVTRELTEKRPDLYRNVVLYGLASPEEIANLRRSRPVRWFDAHEYELRNPFAAHTVATGRENKTLSVIIVDADKLTGITWQQLAAYLAMISLTQPKLGQPHDRHDTILSMFDRRDRGEPIPAGLTALDRATLRAVYAFDEKRPGFFQRSDVAHRVAKSVAEAR